LLAFAISGRRPGAAGEVTGSRWLFARTVADRNAVRHLPAAQDRFLRQITVFMRNDDGSRRRGDGQHGNVLIDTARGPGLLAGEGVEVSLTSAFGAERLPTGLAVLIGRRAPDCRSGHADHGGVTGACLTGQRSPG
jgi:hypothetical protein